MPNHIHLLPENVANQIAAGEVVQRPASVVKELIENSLDANAKNITLIFRDGGKTLMEIIDDGSGMSETDARMSFERHATSKINKSEDLFSLQTMGFRGEALASIAAVAQVEMKTQKQDDELGTRICVEASDVKIQEPGSFPTGTRIIVKNLFFNVPARRNFLKSNAIEARHIMDEFLRIALCRHDIAFQLFNEDEQVYDLPASTPGKRITDLFGKGYLENLIPFQEHSEYLSLEGFISRPDFLKKTRGEQFLFVNERIVRHPYIQHAIISAYESLIPQGMLPFYTLKLNMDPARIDVNVHPAKTEIKFEDERLVYSIVLNIIKRVLGNAGLIPQLEIPVASKTGYPESQSVGTNSVSPRPFSIPNYFQNHPVKGNPDFPQNIPGTWNQFPGGTQLPKENKLFSDSELRTAGEKSEPKNEPVQLFNQFILLPQDHELIVIHQTYASERICYEKYKKAALGQSGTGKRLLFPQTLQLNPADILLLMESANDIQSMGFDFNQLGKDTLVLHAVPEEVSFEELDNFFYQLLEGIKQNRSSYSQNRQEFLLRIMAKKATIKPGKKLEPAEMKSLIEKLFSCEVKSYTPDGVPTFVMLTEAELNGRFSKKK